MTRLVAVRCEDTVVWHAKTRAFTSLAAQSLLCGVNNTLQASLSYLANLTHRISLCRRHPGGRCPAGAYLEVVGGDDGVGAEPPAGSRAQSLVEGSGASTAESWTLFVLDTRF